MSTELMPHRAGLLSRSDAKAVGRGLATIEARSQLELAKIEAEANLQTVRVHSTVYVTRQAMQGAALISELEGQLGQMVPDARGRLQGDRRNRLLHAGRAGSRHRQAADTVIALLEGLTVVAIVFGAVELFARWQKDQEERRRQILEESWAILQLSRRIHDETAATLQAMLDEARRASRSA